MRISSLFLLVAGPELIPQANTLSVSPHSMSRYTRAATKISMSSTTDTDSWANLQLVASRTKVGAALDFESDSRANGTGAPFVQNKLRLFGSNDRPKLTLYRDHAGKLLSDVICMWFSSIQTLNSMHLLVVT